MSWLWEGYWPWWAGALALATVTCLIWTIERRLLGVSGVVKDALTHRSQEERDFDAASSDAIEDAMLKATLEEFGPEAVEEYLREMAAEREESAPQGPPEPTRARLSQRANRVFLLGLVGGGLLGALVSGQFDVATSFHALHTHFFGDGGSYLVLAVGGVLVGFGTRMSGGCTSGHGLSGCGRLDTTSMVGTASFFGTAVVVSFGLQAVLL